MGNKSYWQFFIAISLTVFVVFIVQFHQPLIIGADGYLHNYLAHEMSGSGFLKEIPQAKFSWFETKFSDKDFIYHLISVPFVRLFSGFLGMKIIAFMTASALFIVIIYLLNIYTKSKYLILFSILPIFSAQFLRDTAEARPFTLAILLTLIGIHFLIKEKTILIFIISFVFGLTHLSAWTLIIFAIVLFVYEWASSGRVLKKPLLSVVGGYLLSFIIHPNFPNNIFYIYLNGILVPFYAVKTGVLELGAEFFPLHTHNVLYRFPVLIAGIIFITLSFFLVSYRLKKITVRWGLAVVMFGIFALFATRNFTHLYPIFIVFLGLVTTDFLDEFNKLPVKMRQKIVSVMIVLMFAFANFAFFKTFTILKSMLITDKIYGQHFVKMSRVLSENVEKGSNVFHSNWSDSQFLIGLAPDYYYLVTLDPIYMYSYNRKLYDLYRQVSFGSTEEPYLILKDVFGAKAVYAGKNYFNKFISQIREDERFTLLAEDELGILALLEE